MTKPFVYIGTGHELDEEAAWEYVRNGYLLSPRTVLKGRTKLPQSIPPVSVDLSKISPYMLGLLESSLGQLAGARRAVMFTGGFDSSLVCILAQRCGAIVKAITVQFDEFNPRTVQGAVECAKRIGVDHHILHVKTAEFLSAFEDLAEITDEPLLSLDLAAVYAAFKKYDRRVAGDVFISGMGSDQWFGDVSLEEKPGGLEARLDWAIVDEAAHQKIAQKHGCKFIFPFLTEHMLALSQTLPAVMKKDKSLLRALAIVNRIPHRGAKTEIQIPYLMRRILVKTYGDRAWPWPVTVGSDLGIVEDETLRQIILGLWLEKAKIKVARR